MLAEKVGEVLYASYVVFFLAVHESVPCLYLDRVGEYFEKFPPWRIVIKSNNVFTRGLYKSLARTEKRKIPL